MKLTERLRQLYFAKYDDQMNGLDEDEEKEFKLLNKQILKNQEVAEKVEKYIGENFDYMSKLVDMEERLKKRIEECRCHCHTIMDVVIACADCDCIKFQKILGGEK